MLDRRLNGFNATVWQRFCLWRSTERVQKPRSTSRPTAPTAAAMTAGSDANSVSSSKFDGGGGGGGGGRRKESRSAPIVD